MRRLASLTAALLLIVFAHSAIAQNTVQIEIIRDVDILVIYIGGNQPVNIEGLGFQVVVNGETQAPIYLQSYAGFQAITFNNLQTPVCFVLRALQTTPPLPQRCQNADTTVFIQALFPAEVFWYNTATFQSVSFRVLDETQELGICGDVPLCNIDFPVVQIEIPTSTPEVPVSGDCVMTDKMNLLESSDADDDGYSDFEEACIFRTSILSRNDDTDADGVIDDIETELKLINPNWGDPSVSNVDRDRDWLFDSTELQIGTDPDNPDTDGDLISDFNELYWLLTDPNVAAPDNNSNGFPDVLEGFFPPDIGNLTCRLTISFRIEELWIVAPEEADSFDILEGDEPIMDYGLSIVGEAIDNSYRQSWSAEGVMDEDRIRDFDAIQPLTTNCGETVQIYVSVTETDAPFGGVAELGENNTPIPLIFQRVPIAWNTRIIDEPIIFNGVVEDGDYDYRIYYSLDVQPVINNR